MTDKNTAKQDKPENKASKTPEQDKPEKKRAAKTAQKLSTWEQKVLRERPTSRYCQADFCLDPDHPIRQKDLKAMIRITESGKRKAVYYHTQCYEGQTSRLNEKSHIDDVLVAYQLVQRKHVDEALQIQEQEMAALTEADKAAGKKTRLTGEILLSSSSEQMAGIIEPPGDYEYKVFEY